MPSWSNMPDLLLCSGVNQLPLVLFRVTCPDSCTHVKITRHHFTLRRPYATQLLPVTLVRLQLWQQNRVNDSQTSSTKCALLIQMTSYSNRLWDFTRQQKSVLRKLESVFQISGNIFKNNQMKLINLFKNLFLLLRFCSHSLSAFPFNYFSRSIFEISVPISNL